MSFMGAIGYIMNGSGLDAPRKQFMQTQLYVHHMLNGHIARALRAYFLTSAALTTLLLTETHLEDVDQLRRKYLSLIDTDLDVHDIQVDLTIKHLVTDHHVGK